MYLWYVDLPANSQPSQGDNQVSESSPCEISNSVDLPIFIPAISLVSNRGDSLISSEITPVDTRTVTQKKKDRKALKLAKEAAEKLLCVASVISSSEQIVLSSSNISSNSADKIPTTECRGTDSNINHYTVSPQLHIAEDDDEVMPIMIEVLSEPDTSSNCNDDIPDLIDDIFYDDDCHIDSTSTQAVTILSKLEVIRSSLEASRKNSAILVQEFSNLVNDVVCAENQGEVQSATLSDISPTSSQVISGTVSSSSEVPEGNFGKSKSVKRHAEGIMVDTSSTSSPFVPGTFSSSSEVPKGNFGTSKSEKRHAEGAVMVGIIPDISPCSTNSPYCDSISRASPTIAHSVNSAGDNFEPLHVPFSNDSLLIYQITSQSDAGFRQEQYVTIDAVLCIAKTYGWLNILESASDWKVISDLGTNSRTDRSSCSEKMMALEVMNVINIVPKTD